MKNPHAKPFSFTLETLYFLAAVPENPLLIHCTGSTAGADSNLFMLAANALGSLV